MIRKSKKCLPCDGLVTDRQLPENKLTFAGQSKHNLQHNLFNDTLPEGVPSKISLYLGWPIILL